ncbi:MAG TPA: hypothetical protein DCR11_10700 [Deltaproteobacteria bacterium]|nr:hypothetical protein [Deltaproteobacteria bacterium]
MNKLLKTGDTIRWRGLWGEAQEKPAVVTGIQIRCTAKYGTEVTEASWADVKGHGVVDLDNGHWAYGYQVDPVDEVRDAEI